MNIKDSPLYAESWNVAYRTTLSGKILDDTETQFTVIPNSIRYWAADPMVFEYHGIRCIFAELYDYTLRRGVIGISVYNKKTQKFGKWEPVIVEAFHMSYPYVFENEGHIYMIPESRESGSLYLYEAVEFPYRWKLKKQLLKNISLVDTTIVPSKDGFWGYTQEIENQIKNYKIYIDSFFQKVNMEEYSIPGDEDRLRPGGRPFKYKNQWYRVCQDGREDYGRALCIRLLVDDGNNKTSVAIYPEDYCFSNNIYIKGMHTYSSLKDMEVIDIKTRRFNLINFLFRLINKVSPRKK